MAKGSFGRMAGAVALVLAGAGAAVVAAQDAPPVKQVFATGLVEVGADDYATLPTVRRYRAFFPDAVDLSSRFPKPGHQGNTGSCSAWATSYAARSFLTASDGKVEAMSPSYVFNHTRPGPNCMLGNDLPKSLNFLRDVGTVPMSEFVTEDCNMRPPTALTGTAQRYRIGGYRKIPYRNEATGALSDDPRFPLVIDDIKGALHKGQPVVFGMFIPRQGFKQELNGFDGVFQSNERFDRSPYARNPGVERHGMALVGYDNDRKAFRLINSWGDYWGKGGFLWIGYETFMALAFEAYVVEPVGAPPPPKPVPPVPQESVQDRLARALSQPICGKLAVRWTGERATIEGFGDPGEVAVLKTRAQGIPGVTWRVRDTPFPTCEAELLVDGGLNDGSVRVEVADAAGRPLTGELVTLKKDGFFSIDVESDAKPYVQVFYLQADGSAVELYRGAPQKDAQGRRRVQVGAAGATARRFQVAEPFGYEALIAVASAKPVIAEPLGAQATERMFLSRLKTAIVNARRDRPSAALRRLRTIAG